MELYGCEWNAAWLLIFSDNVGPFIYYSHLAPMIASLILGTVVLLNNRRGLTNWALFMVTLAFAAYCYIDLILWASPSPEHVIFFWQMIVPIELLIYASSLYLVYLFANGQKDISLGRKIAIAALFIPILALLHTQYTVSGLSPDCDEGAIEGPVIQYLYFAEMFMILWAAVVAASGYQKLKDVRERRQLLFISFGVIFFLIAFSAGNVILMLSLETIYDQYKLFGMPVFLAFLTYSIVKFRAFNAKILLAQALVIALAILTISILFLRTIENVQIVTVATFILVCILGFILIRNVRREVDLRQQTQKLAQELAETNQRQESLIHFVGHEVKGFLTKDIAVFAALVEGDLGQLPDSMKPFVENALSQSRDGATSVIDILHASNQKKGTVEYHKQPFDFAALVKKWAEKLKPVAEKKGLTLSLTIDETAGSYTLIGDESQTGDHVLRNLIENAINYTPTGSISLSLAKKGPFAVFTVADTGVGISTEDRRRLFTEGGHGKDSLKINAHSTGYGLFIAKNIIEAEGGTVRAESEGPGKGSQFIVALPLDADHHAAR